MNLLTFDGWLSGAPEWIATLPSWLQTFFFQLYQTFIYQNRWTFFTNGLKITFIVTIGALILGIITNLILRPGKAEVDKEVKYEKETEQTMFGTVTKEEK